MLKNRLKKLEEKIGVSDDEPIKITVDIVAMDKSIVKSYILKDGILCQTNHA